MSFSFLKGLEVVPMAKATKGPKADPLGTAKKKITDAIGLQIQAVNADIAKTDFKPKADSTRPFGKWYYEVAGTYYTTIRYGQLPIVLDGTNTAVKVGKLDKLAKFYGDVKKAIDAGEMDAVIEAMQKKRSASLTGAPRRPKK